MMILYNILYFIAFISYLPVLLVRGKLHAGFIQRLGFLDQDLRYRLSQRPNIWFHAVSVGEVLAIVGLVERIRIKNPERQIVISVVTTTGYALAQKRFKKEDVIIFAPLDLGFSAQSFIRAIKPEIFILAETELWPQLLTALSKIDVPMVMVNGRIADRSFYGYRRFQFLFRSVLRVFRGLCMQSPSDADRIISLGANPKNVIVAGSMKFDDVLFGEIITLRQLGLQDDALVWVAGSTHPGEEKIVLDVYKKMRTKFPSMSLILAPRHVDRSEEVCSLVSQSGFSVERFSTVRGRPHSADAVIVVDGIGHLKSLYRLATIVFVGKSLVGNGGQNIIEPAFFGKSIIVGPHMQNFANITEIFLSAHGIIQIQEASELEGEVYKLLSSQQLRQALGQRAQLTVEKNKGATSQTEKILSQLLSASQFVKPV